MAKKIIHNAETGEIVEVDLTNEDLLYFANLAEEKEKIETAKNEAQIAKAALLEKLGITQEEAKLLLS